MATVHNFKGDQTTDMTIQAHASQKQKSCKATHKPTHNAAHLFALQHQIQLNLQRHFTK